MENLIVDERTGLRYELVGDCYLLAGDDEIEQPPFGVWARRRCKFLRDHKECTYTALLLSGKLDDHLTETENSAQVMMDAIVSRLKQERGIAETLKATDQMRWVAEMENIRASAEETVLNDLIYQ